MEISEKIAGLRAQSPAQLLQAANLWLPQWLALALVVLIAWQAANFLWAIIPGEPDFDWSKRPAASAQRSTSAPVAVDFRAVAEAHLFGEAGAEPPPETAVSAPETRMNLKLRGTIAAEDETIAHAIIADGNNKANVYFVEDSVPGGASLHEVYPDRVILKRGGAFETLRLPKESQSLGLADVPRMPSNTDEHGSPRNTGSVREALQGNPASFTEIIRPQPYMPNGELKGYRVYPGRDRRAFAALGLRPGDLVTDINGQALNNIRSGMEVFRGIGEASQITVTIERNGSAMVLSLDSSQFNNAAGARK